MLNAMSRGTFSSSDKATVGHGHIWQGWLICELRNLFLQHASLSNTSSSKHSLQFELRHLCQVALEFAEYSKVQGLGNSFELHRGKAQLFEFYLQLLLTVHETRFNVSQGVKYHISKAGIL